MVLAKAEYLNQDRRLEQADHGDVGQSPHFGGPMEGVGPISGYQRAGEARRRFVDNQDYWLG